MARQTYTRIVSDLSGNVLEEGESETIAFGFGKDSYTIDLSKEEADEFRKVIGKYTDAAQHVSSSSSSRNSRASSGNRNDKEYLRKVRLWAADNGIQVNTRGRISQSVIEQYEAAQ